MAGNIKGITVEFRGDTTQLDKALRKVDKESRSIDNELKKVNRSLKFNPRNVDLLKQKQQLLNAKVSETSEKLKVLKQAQKQMANDPSVDKNSAEYRNLQREIIETESKLKHFEGELKRFGTVGKQQALAVGRSMQQLGGRIKSAGRTITTTASVWGAAGVYAGARLIDSYEKQAEAELKLERVYKSNMKAGKAAAQSTIEYASALQEQGVIGDEVTIAGAAVLAQYADTPGAINKILPAMDNYLAKTKGLDATQEDAEAAAKLFGKALNGNYTTLERNGIVLTDNQKAMLDAADAEEKAAILADIVAQKTGNMNTALAETDAGKLQQAKNTIGDMGESIGQVLLPAVASLADWLQDNLLPKVQAVIDYLQAHPMIGKIALALMAITAALGPLIMLIGSVIGIVGTLVTITTALDIALAPIAGTIGLIVLAIAAVVAAGILLYKNWDTIKAKAAQVWSSITKAVSIVVNKVKQNFNTLKSFLAGIWNGIKTGATVAWNAIKTAITKPIQTAFNLIKKIVSKIKGLFNVKIKFPHVPLPHFKISPAGWKVSDLLKGKIPSLGIKWYAQGGIFDSPTIAGIGEAGPEAVVPLNTLWKKLDAIADSSGAAPIVVNVYGSNNMSVDELAAAVEQRIIQMQKRRTQAWA